MITFSLSSVILIEIVTKVKTGDETPEQQDFLGGGGAHDDSAHSCQRPRQHDGRASAQLLQEPGSAQSGHGRGDEGPAHNGLVPNCGELGWEFVYECGWRNPS